MVNFDNEIKVWFRFDNTEELGDFVDYVNEQLHDMPMAEQKRYAWDDTGDDEWVMMYILLENVPVAKKWVEDFNAQKGEPVTLTTGQKALANELTGDMPYPYSLMVNNNPLVTGDDVYASLDDAKANAEKLLKDDAIESVQVWYHGCVVWNEIKEKPKPKLNIRPWRKMEIDGDIETLQSLYEKISTIIKEGYIECYYDDGWIEICYYPNEEKALMQAIEVINNGKE